MENQNQATGESIDPILIAAIVRKVIARLTEPTPAVACDNGVVSVKTIEQQTGKRLVVAKSAVITPAARDEARLRGITIERTNETSVSNSQTSIQNVSDIDDPSRAETIRRQLDRRGIDLSVANVVLSDSPALEVHRQISGGQSAAMVTEISDVERFQSELSPSIWVLDMKRLNIPSAVNAVAKISQLASISQQGNTKR